jgi:predicted DNA binding protein
LYDVSFRLMHAGCPFAEISKRHEGSIVQWCGVKSDVFEVRGKDAENTRKAVNEFRRLARELGSAKMRVLSFGGEGSGVILQALSSCMCVRALKSRNVTSVVRIITKNRCVQIPPTIYKAGWEYYSVLAFDPSDFKNLFKALSKIGPIEIMSKKSYNGVVPESFTVSLRGLFSGLTTKQLDAYVGALENGYYAVPRRTTIGKIARARRVARTTYDDHLRKAESKVALAISPYLRIYAAASYA